MVRGDPDVLWRPKLGSGFGSMVKRSGLTIVLDFTGGKSRAVPIFTSGSAPESMTVAGPLLSVLEQAPPRRIVGATGARCIILCNWMRLPGQTVRERSER